MRPQGRPNWTGPSFPHHSGKAAGLELPFPSPLYLSGARGGWLGPENSHRCDGEGACWPEPALPKPLLRFRAFSIPDLTGSSHPQGHHPPATNIRSHQIMGLYSTSITHSQFYWTWGPGVVQWGRVNRGGYKVWPLFSRGLRSLSRGCTSSDSYTRKWILLSVLEALSANATGDRKESRAQ